MRKPEVHDADSSTAVEHDVRRLQVAMNHAALMRRCQSGAQLTRDIRGFVFRETADAAERRREILAIDVLHRQIELAGSLADVVYAAHVGMRDLTSGADLVVELCEPRRITAEILGQEFQRDGLAETQIVGAIDFAHAAATEEADDSIPVVEYGAWRKAAMIDRVRCREPSTRRGPRAGRWRAAADASGCEDGDLLGFAGDDRVVLSRTSTRRTESCAVRSLTAAGWADHGRIVTWVRRPSHLSTSTARASYK